MARLANEVASGFAIAESMVALVSGTKAAGIVAAGARLGNVGPRWSQRADAEEEGGAQHLVAEFARAGALQELVHCESWCTARAGPQYLVFGAEYVAGFLCVCFLLLVGGSCPLGTQRWRVTARRASPRALRRAPKMVVTLALQGPRSGAGRQQPFSWSNAPSSTRGGTSAVPRGTSSGWPVSSRSPRPTQGCGHR